MRLFKVVFLALAVLGTSCATVREVRTKPGKGGELAVKEGMFGETADVKAGRIMKQNCPKGFAITEKGEEVVGTKTTHDSSTHTKKAKSKNGGIVEALSADTASDTSGSSETVNTTEWRIKYKCKKQSSAD
ncbi:MAG: hypothetical protein EOP07_03360 [Proteobacteria bacterium]|nr:MAG: hypothetical protein EOP07_03360 [Pseudomonadota bacterium]